MSQTPPPAPGEKGYWRWLYNLMLASLADQSFMRFNGYTVPGRTFQFRGLAEFRAFLAWVEDKANLEDGIRPYIGRTHAGMRRRR